jgi:TP901 family phage tail tape measure protein
MYKYSMEIESNVKKLLLDTKELQDRMDTLEGKEYKINLNIDEKKLGNVISNLEKMLDSLGKGTGDFKQFENLSKELSNIVSEVQSLSKAFGKVDDSGAKTLLSSIQNIDKSLSELSQNILNVNKNMSNMGGNTSGAVKQVENISDAYQNAAKEAEELADAQSKIGQKTNISSASDSPSEASRNNNISDSIKKKKEALASYELQLEETRYEVEKLSKSENKVYGFNRSYDDKKVASLRDSVTKRLFGEYDPSSGKDGSKKWLALGRITNIDTSTLKSYQMWQEELQKVGYTLSEIKQTSMGLEADIIPIDGKAITNAEEFRKILDNISTTPTENVQLLNKQITELESKISSLKSEIASLESPASNQKKDAFPDKDISASVESATNSIKEENNVLEQNTQKVKENTQAKEQNANVNFNKYDKRLDSYNGKIDKYKTTIDRFNDGGWTSNTYLENVQAVKNAVHEYETLLNELKGKDASLVTSDDISKLDEYEKKIKDAIATVTNMSAAEKGYNFVSGQKELDKIHKLLNENSKMSSEAKAKIKAYYTEIESGNPSISLDRIHGEIMKIYNAEVEAGRAGRSFFDTLKNSGFHQLAAQMSGMFGFYDVINIGKQAISTIVSLDDALVDLKKTTAMNKTQLEQYYYDANDVAKQMGVTTEEIINQSSAWSRLGYNTAEASTEMAKLSSQFASISPGMGVDEAQSGLVSIMKAWSIDPDQVKSEIMDPINQLGNTMAEDNQDIVEGMERSAAALAAVGTSTKDAFALFSGIQEVLQNAEKSGTSLKSVALRLRSFDETTGEYSEDLANITGELIDLTKTAEHAEGVSIFKPGSTTEFKDLTDYFREIAGIWDEMTQKQQNDFLIKAFGRNQAQAGAALIQNFKAVDKALAEMGESAGSSDKEMEAVESSLSYKINALKETWVGCVQDMIDRGDLGTIVIGLTKVSEAITFLLDKLGILGSIGLGAGIFSGIKNVGIDTLVAY